MVRYFCDRCEKRIPTYAVDSREVAVGYRYGHATEKWSRDLCKRCRDITRTAILAILTETIQPESNGELFAKSQENQEVGE